MSTITVSAGLAAPRPRRASTVQPAGPARSARPVPAARARLTRRGRLLLSALSLALLVASAVLSTGGLPAVAGIGGGADRVVAERVTVRPGETLWAIAQREAPGVDPRETVARIMDLNALRTAAVEAGSVILLPTD